MRLAPKIAFAAAVIAIGGATGGAVIGAQIGDAEILQRASVGGERPGYDFQADSDAPSLARTAERPADQYAIETPEGRFEVGELRNRGLYRNRRYSHYDAALAAEDRAWDAEMAALERGDWQPDPGFADSEWSRAGGNAHQSQAYGVTVTRNVPSRTRVAMAPEPQAQTVRSDMAPPAIGPDQVQPLDVPAPVTLPPPSPSID
ncbi:hypothetical protein A3736_03310 [Erythrobacter sp. HI0063]|jgi:hypothetical protein|uniref:hypothetical protein n=1 Tax=Erythrobacter sp. HI0063 TaxID=1822240 RepID=UPI0007C404D6|nr:hypothetical protein [Erythrobacter sp. HI0063]KZY58386.1 hypothetical protein A3736_03310 [Erythrobacter sp. HI0063]